jgi:glycosyltransferase involved in cell wall biosynthesis
MKILLLDTKRSNPNHYLCRSVLRAFRRHPLVSQARMCDYGTCVTTARSLKPDLFLALDGEDVHHELVGRVCGQAAHSAVWFTDDPYVRTSNLAVSGMFDTVFTNDSASVSAYGVKGLHLPFAADRDAGRDPLEEGLLYDLFFLGTAWPNRVDYVRRLLAACAGRRRLKVGLPTNPYLPPFSLPVPRSDYDWKAAQSEFVEFAHHSVATLTLHRTFATGGADAAAATPGPRLFETALAGTAQIVDDGLDEVATYYEPGRELLLARDPEECMAHVERLCRDPGERARLARTARERTLAHHTYDHRVERIIDVVRGRRSGVTRRPIRACPAPPCVLMVTHNPATMPPYGGIERYQQWIVERLGSEYRFLFYAPERIRGVTTTKTGLYDASGRMLRTYALSSRPDNGTWSDREREHAFAKMLCEVRPSAIHFQQLLDHTLSLPVVSRAMGIPSLFTLHDFFAICSRFNLLGFQGRYCGIHDGDATSCDICLNACQGQRAGTQSTRLARSLLALKAMDCIHVAHEGSLGAVKALFGGVPAERLEVFPMPVLTAASSTAPDLPAGPVHVAVPGNMTANKGADTIVHVMNMLRREEFVFHVFGAIEPRYREILAALAMKHVILHGGYDMSDVGRLYAPTSVSLHLSIWPETWCMALDEAWQHHVVPIVTDLGAPAARVVHGKNGFVVPPDDPAAVVTMLRRLAACRDMLSEMRSWIAAHPLRTDAEHGGRLRAIYAELCAAGADVAPFPGAVGSAPIDVDLCRVPMATAAEAAAPGRVGDGGAGVPPLLARALSYYAAHGIRRTAEKVFGRLRGG